MEIVRATPSHIPEVSRLFNLYRQFYKCEPDINLATEFIAARIKNKESIIFAAEQENQLKGFVQMYPSFCSVDAIKILILYDLYVDRCDRKAGIGEALMEKAADFAGKSGFSRLDLLTDHDNKAGQHLYEKLGYKKVNETFYAYSLQI